MNARGKLAVLVLVTAAVGLSIATDLGCTYLKARAFWGVK